MNRRSTAWVGAWLDLARRGARASRRLGKIAARHVAAPSPQLVKAGQWLLSGVATPAPAPVAPRGGGRWEDGMWGLGPLAMRRWRLFMPPVAAARRPLPVVMLLHGCGQDAASFAAATRAAAAARAGGFALLLPEQSAEANPQRCWNWFRPEAVVGAEAAILVAILDHVCSRYPLRADRVFALGLSAGGAMAMSLALHHPERFVAVGSHSGAVPHSAATPVQAGQAMRGRRAPALAALRRRLRGRPLPPLFLIHGDADRAVAPANAQAAAELWLELARPGSVAGGAARTVTRAARPYTVAEWTREGRPYVRLVSVTGLGHAWSGGTRRQAFADPHGPDALRLAWRFFARCADPRQGAGRR